MRPKINLEGKKFNRLTYLHDVEFRVYNNQRQRCAKWRCDCGNEIEIEVGHVRKGISQSCGCLRDEKIREACRTHGLTKHPLHITWQCMKERCLQVRSKSYYIYGGRGITICDEWRNDFKVFFDWAIANRWEKGLDIDRINTNGNYEPINCRFVTRKENQNNRRNNVRITYNGQTKTLMQWSESTGLSYSSLQYRVKNNFSADRIFLQK